MFLFSPPFFFLEESSEDNIIVGRLLLPGAVVGWCVSASLTVVNMGCCRFLFLSLWGVCFVVRVLASMPLVGFDLGRSVALCYSLLHSLFSISFFYSLPSLSLPSVSLCLPWAF